MSIKPLLPHQQRVVQERDELQQRTVKLDDFVQSNPNFLALEQEDKDLLTHQLTLHYQLLDILNNRIARF